MTEGGCIKGVCTGQGASTWGDLKGEKKNGEGGTEWGKIKVWLECRIIKTIEGGKDEGELMQ